MSSARMTRTPDIIVTGRTTGSRRGDRAGVPPRGRGARRGRAWSGETGRGGGTPGGEGGAGGGGRRAAGAERDEGRARRERVEPLERSERGVPVVAEPCRHPLP